MKGNVLVIGNSGVGKSTLINAVLGEKTAKTGWGTKGTTDKLEIYENESIPFRIIDTIGFESSFIKKIKAIYAVKSWSKNSAKAGNEDSQINVIWFCVDGTSSKLFDETMKSLYSAISMWESIPVIVTITKSYSVPEREKNIEMVNNAFSKKKKYSKNLKKVIPVVAATYMLNDTAYAAPEGIMELIDATNELMPEGIKSSEIDVANLKFNRKRFFAQSIVAASTTAAIVVGAVPIPYPDAMFLAPIEIAEVNALAKIYGIKNDEESKRFFNSIVEVGSVSIVAKGAITALKAIPGINIGASILNAVIAAFIVAAIGEGSIYVFEQIYYGNKTVKDIDWATKILESQFSAELINKAQDAIKSISDIMDDKTIVKTILEVFAKK